DRLRWPRGERRVALVQKTSSHGREDRGSRRLPRVAQRQDAGDSGIPKLVGRKIYSRLASEDGYGYFALGVGKSGVKLQKSEIGGRASRPPANPTFWLDIRLPVILSAAVASHRESTAESKSLPRAKSRGPLPAPRTA